MKTAGTLDRGYPIEYASHQMKQALSGLDRIARGDQRVNVFGETGTGKEGVARDIHYKSPRSGKTNACN